MRFITCLVMLFTSLSALGAVSAEWIRSPSISPDGKTIVFTYKGDLYRVAASGGEAMRLTFHEAHDTHAVWHPDGKQIAFASNRHGNFDIYTMPASGGQAQRLTFHSTNETPYSYSADGDYVVFSGTRMDTASHRQSPDGTFPELYQVSAEGSAVEQLMTVTASEVDYSDNGRLMLYMDKKGGENYWRKHHKSSVTRDVWLYDVRKDTHRQLTQYEGEDRSPVFGEDNDTFYYLSEQNGTFNVFSSSIDDPSAVKQLTDFSLHPVRFLSFGNGVLSFTHHGKLFTMAEGKSPKEVKVTVRTQDASNNISYESIAGEISEFAVSPNGDEIAIVAMGDVFVASTDGAFVKQITDTPEREAFISFGADGETLYYAAQRNTQWGIYSAVKRRAEEPFFYASSLIDESPLRVNDKDNYQPQVSPDGEKIAFVEDRRTLRVMNVDGTDAKTLVPRSEMIHFRDGDQEFSWSPDSQWILFTHSRLLNNSDIAIVSASGDAPFKPLTLSAFYDYSAKWVNGGKQILWTSNREGMRSYATSGRRQTDVFTMFFNDEDWDEFRLSEDDFALQQAIDEANEEESEEASDDEGEGSEAEEEPSLLTFNWDGLEDRIARLTIHSSRLSDAVLSKEGDTLYYLTRFEGDLDLWSTDVRTGDTQKLISLGAGWGVLSWDNDHETLYLLSDGGLSTLDVENGSSDRISINHRVEVDNQKLMQTTFEHVWLRTFKTFYEPTFHGIDWKQMYDEYKPKVAHLANGYEMAELLSEMIGELNVSHAGAGYRSRSGNDDNTARLGAFFDYQHKGNGLKVFEVLSGGPLDKSSVNIGKGDVITHIDGVEITDDFDWAKLLNRKADTFVLLTVTPANGKERNVTVKPISGGEESDLLYERFVERNEAEVLARSNGQLGYVHIPSMSDGPYRTVFDTMLGKHYDKKAIVVDTRFNGGGDLVADLAMFFTGEQFLTYETADKLIGGEPTSRYTKPVVTLFNEDMYSDGHCYASGFTDLEIGTSVGMPVPGTCSFAGWEGLPTGGYWGMVPVSAKNKAGEWLENNQTDPDILVKNMPAALSTGRDQQLEKAIEVLLEQVSND